MVVSISPQSRAALAAFYGLSPAETLQKLTGFFKGLGVRAVLDTSTGRDFALLETAAEFVERYRETHPELAGGILCLSGSHQCAPMLQCKQDVSRKGEDYCTSLLASNQAYV